MTDEPFNTDELDESENEEEAPNEPSKEEPLILAEDEKITTLEEDDNPEGLVGDEVDDDGLDVDPDAALLYPDEEEDTDGNPGA